MKTFTVRAEHNDLEAGFDEDNFTVSDDATKEEIEIAALKALADMFNCSYYEVLSTPKKLNSDE